MTASRGALFPCRVLQPIALDTGWSGPASPLDDLSPSCLWGRQGFGWGDLGAIASAHAKSPPMSATAASLGLNNGEPLDPSSSPDMGFLRRGYGHRRRKLLPALMDTTGWFESTQPRRLDGLGSASA